MIEGFLKNLFIDNSNNELNVDPNLYPSGTIRLGMTKISMSYKT